MPLPQCSLTALRLLFVDDFLRCRAAYSNLRGYLLQAGSKRFNLLLLLCDGRFLFLILAMFFQELIEQHWGKRWYGSLKSPVLWFLGHLPSAS